MSKKQKNRMPPPTTGEGEEAARLPKPGVPPPCFHLSSEEEEEKRCSWPGGWVPSEQICPKCRKWKKCGKRTKRLQVRKWQELRKRHKGALQLGQCFLFLPAYTPKGRIFFALGVYSRAVLEAHR
jgi:hypothetical protein